MHRPFNVRHFVFLLFVSWLSLLPPVASAATETDGDWLPASAQKLPRWRGFNLLNKFNVGRDRPFDEVDFQIIHDFGFNFVRLPMDYRIWIVGKDWTQLDENKLKEIDPAVAWGRKYHVHVCLNFHRAPGYTVAKPPEEHSVWTDEEAQRVCALHWAAFARRYKGIPATQLSFNLFNEPSQIDAATYYKVVAKMVAAIRQEDPDRLIIADGLSWGTVPCPELIPLHVAQATRGYQPMEISHYHASWIKGSENFQVPTWPIIIIPGLLYGPPKTNFHSPLILEGRFAEGAKLSFTVGTVSDHARLVVRADEKIIFDKTFVSGPVAHEGEKVDYRPEYKIYQNIFNQPNTLTLSHAASRLTLTVEAGDWLTLTKLAMQPSEASSAYPLSLSPRSWGVKQVTASFDATKPDHPWSTSDQEDRLWLWQNKIAPWQALETQGVGVFVGEWGCHNQTPYPVTLHWMEDCLANFKKAGWGWSLWNLYGSFGIMDSDRSGAVYEEYKGHKLDRKMLKLLQEY